MTIKWIDSHAHTHFAEDGGFAEIDQLNGGNIEKVLCVATELKQHAAMKLLYEKYPEYVLYSLGVHPLDDNLQKTDWDLFEKIVEQDVNIIALGETGFDISGSENAQHEAYERHIYLAKKHNLPIIMHARDNDKAAIEAIKKHSRVRGVLHCFTGALELAKVAVDHGWKVSFSGIITFKKAEEIRFVARALPLDALLIETDAPYLAPEPMRGSSNRSQWVQYVGEYVAKLLNLDAQKFANQIRVNFYDLFKSRS